MSFTLSPGELTRLLGTAWRELPLEVQRLGDTLDLRYERLSGEERDEIIRDEVVLETPDRVGPNGWNACWRDVLARWRRNGKLEEDLVPDFLRRVPPPVRLFGEYVIPRSPTFVWSVQRIILAHLAARHLDPKHHAANPAIFELGCGSGFNLIALQKMLPSGTPFYGLDYSEAAVETVAALSLNGLHFNMFEPQQVSPKLLNGAAVLTMGALEQIGSRWKALLAWLREARPAVCVHVEPFVELYNELKLTDYLAARYHRARDYLEGFLPALSAVELLEVHRVPFGARHNDGFSWVVWRPK